MDVDALITAVERRKTLYDKMDPDYSNRNYVNAEWKKIAEEVGCDESEARRKWKQLRDYFQRNHRVMTSRKSGSAVNKKKKWYLYDRMYFILPHMTDRHSNSTSTNMLTVSLSSDEEGVDFDFEDGMLTMSQASSFCSNESQSDTPSPLPTKEDNQDEIKPCVNPPELEKESRQNPPRKRQRVFPKEQATQLSDFESEEEGLPLLKAEKRLGETNVVATDFDEDEHFFKHLVPKMKLLSTIDKMECQAEIHMVVLKYIKKANHYQASVAQ